MFDELNWTDLFSEKNTGCTGQEKMLLTYTLQKQKVQSKLEHEWTWINTVCINGTLNNTSASQDHQLAV